MSSDNCLFLWISVNLFGYLKHIHTCGLELLHPLELVHGVLQASDPVVVEKKKSEAGQMI